MRVPLAYSATQIVNWHISEEYELGKWRPARCCGFSGWKYTRMRLRLAWAVFTGRYDALYWGDSSGELPADKRRYKDCTEPEFFTATRVYEMPNDY